MALEDIILDGLKHRLMAPELVVEFVREVHAEINKARDQTVAVRAARAGELAQVDRKLNGLIDAIADGFRAPGLQQQLDVLEARKAEIAAELEAPEPSPLRLHPNLAQLYRDKVANLREALQDGATRDEAMEILRGLIERVEMQPAKDGYEVTLVGEIANMISLSSGKTAGKADQLPSSVKVVAGAGLEPATQGL